MRSHGHARHGSRSPEYRAWEGMRRRCSTPTASDYPRYGGRGIRVAPEWDSFERFLVDVGPRPSPAHSIDRYPDNDGHYEPGNVRWATAREQQANTRQTVLLESGGVTLPLSEWARRLGLSKEALWRRLNVLGWTTVRALTTPARHYGRRR